MSTLSVEIPTWAHWRPSAPYTVGLEEEVMLLDADGELAHAAEDVLAAAGPALEGRAAAETHGAALELATAPHARVGGAVAELAGLRAELAAVLAGRGLHAAVAGLHPAALREDVEVSPAARYQHIASSMRVLARREPTFALHVHVGVADAESAIVLHDRLRAHLPLLLALSANSPYWRGDDTGLASARTPVFGTFPRTGIPRGFASYADWVGAVQVLVDAGALPEPTMLWWDVRLQPRFGTVEVRVMDAQSRLGETAALAALVQCLARLELEQGCAHATLLEAPEVLEENRFLAARDGIGARFVDPDLCRRVSSYDVLDEVLRLCAPHAVTLGASEELRGVRALAARSGADRQREAADEGGLPAALASLAADFSVRPGA